MNTDPRADAHLALCRVTWPFDEPHVLGSGAFIGKLPLFDDLGEIDVVKAVQAYQDFYIGLQSLGFCPWTCLAFTPKGLDPLLRAALGDQLPDEAALHFGRAAFSLERSGVLFPESDVPPAERFRKLAQESIADGPRKGQKLDIMRLWQDYLEFRDHAAVESKSFGEGA
jgi:aldehyde:ferredoxin oxidoreductase